MVHSAVIGNNHKICYSIATMSTVEKLITDAGGTKASSTQQRRLFKCAATEIILREDGEAVAAHGLASDKTPFPGGLLARSIVCAACFEECSIVEDAEGKMVMATLPNCGFALDLIHQTRNYEVESVISVPND
jgi:hypothetical protein